MIITYLWMTEMKANNMILVLKNSHKITCKNVQRTEQNTGAFDA